MPVSYGYFDFITDALIFFTELMQGSPSLQARNMLIALLVSSDLLRA